MNRSVWDREPWPELPRLEGDVAADVCVVGLGGSGLACIGELLARGRSVVGVDADTVAGGAAGRNAGFLLAGLADFHHHLAASIGRDAARALYALTVDEIGRMARETPQVVRLTGSLRIAASPAEEEDCLAQLEALRDDGFAAVPYDGPEGRGLLVPGDGVFDPLRRARLLASRAIERGARLFEHSEVLHIDGTSVHCRAGTVRCGCVLVAVDGRLGELIPELAVGARPARLQMLATAPAPEIRVPRPVYARWGLDYWRQLDDGGIALGGFRDVGGAAEWSATPEVTAPVQEALERFLRGALGVRAPITHRWASIVSYTDDRLPVHAEVRPGVFALGAYSGTGNVVGPLCGRGTADLITRGRSEVHDVLARARAVTRPPG